MPEPLRDGLPPVIADGARVLLLGLFPARGRWAPRRVLRQPAQPVLAADRGCSGSTPTLRTPADRGVTEHGVALWDVVHSCRRAGSLDVKIDRKLVVNDFGPMLAQHPGIGRVFVNGLRLRTSTATSASTDAAHRAAAVQQRRVADVVRGQAGALARSDGATDRRPALRPRPRGFDLRAERQQRRFVERPAHQLDRRRDAVPSSPHGTTAAG